MWWIPALFLLFSQVQTPPPSHQERFAPPRLRFERQEEQATLELAKDPADFSALRARSVARIKLGKLDAALLDLEKVLALQPDSGEARADLAYVLWLRGDLERAMVEAREAVRLAPDLYSGHFYLGRLTLLTGGPPAEAVQHLERALELNPLDTELRFDLLTAYRGLGDTIRAAVQLQILQAAYPPEEPRVLYAEGLIAADLDQIPVAVEKFRKTLELEPRLAAARTDLGVALVRLERWDEAADVLGQAVAEQPKSVEAAHFHALALYNAQRSAEAETELRRAMELDPAFAPNHTLLGVLLSARGERVAAAEAFARAARLAPDDFDAQFYRGRADYGLRNLETALTALSTAVRLRPDHADARFFLATTLESLGRSEEAAGEYRELLRLDPADARGNVGLGALLLKRGEASEAVLYLEKTLAVDPDHFEARLALGRALFQLGDPSAAVEHLERAVALQPKSVDAHYQLALSLQKAGRADEARRQFEIVKTLNEEFRRASAGEKGEKKP